MRSNHLSLAACLAVSLVAPVALASCGEEETLEVIEGEPLELGEVAYNVQLTRILNPDDDEDSAYLAGQPDAGPGEAYLGVFMQIENEGEHPANIPLAFRVVDTTGQDYSPLDSQSLYVLDLGGTLAPDGQLPPVNSTAAAGPISGSMVLFRVDESISESRPIELEVPSAEGHGTVELDI